MLQGWGIMDIPNANQIPQLLAYERATLSENMHIYNLRQKHFGWNGSISQLRQKGVPLSVCTK